MLLDKLNIILNSNDEFSPKYIISSFVKNNLYEIPSMSIDAIALSCHTSKSQISKYVKSLGYETMKDFKELKIEIPEGCFEGNCYDCRYADWSDKDQYGRVYCRGSYGGYNKPSDRNGCFHFKN